MIGHSLGRVETYFGPSTQGAGIRYQNTSQIQILRHFKKGEGCRNSMLAGLDAFLASIGVVSEVWAEFFHGRCARGWWSFAHLEPVRYDMVW